ncbi:hypothetical protein P8452_50571 [Trifolium repens]|nr:hypothetical protein P8452_50571 [Trifolium repens]
MSNLLELSLNGNNINGPIPGTFKGLHKLGLLDLGNNGLQGSFIEELCEIEILGNNSFNNMIPFSLWNLTNILEVNLSSNSFVGNLPYEIGNLKILSLAHNKLNGSIPTSLGGDMVSLISLDLSQNMLTGIIPKSLESLSYLQNLNLSYNRLQGEIPDVGILKSFTAQSFMNNEALCGNPRLNVPVCDNSHSSTKKKLLLKCIIPILVSSILIVACIIILKVKKRKMVENTLERGFSTLGAPRRISYYEVVQATNGFNESNLLGKGGFGSVYRGALTHGEMIAVKIISGVSNLDFKALVMEFMLNGSVDKWLYSNNYCLNFLQRLNIMIDVASALEYLHHGSTFPVVHCDLKPSNVLLDENMVAHVSDFGIAKLMDEGQSKAQTNTLATIGYLAPEYGSSGIVSVKGDVYSYGIMLMEIFTRKKPTDEMFVEELSLKTWISRSLPNSIMDVLDSNLVQQNGEQIDDILTYMSSIFGLALNCCEDSPEARINMVDFTASLIKIKTLVLGVNRI